MAGGLNIQQILGYVKLTGLVQATISGIPNTLPPAFMTTTRPTLGDSGRYTRVTGERRTAKITKYGAPSTRRELRTVGSVDVKLLHSFENQPIPPLVMQQLRNYDNYEVQKMGISEVSRQVKEFGQLFGNLRIAAVQQVLANAVLYVDGNNNLLPTSVGAIETYVFQMLAAHQNQLNNGTAAIITNPWSDPTTNIPLQLVNLEERQAQETGYPLKYAIYGKNIPTYFTNNDFVLDYLARMPDMSAQWLKNPGVVPQGLFGYTWIPAYTMHYRDVTDTTVNAIWDPNKVVFTPEISEDWWEIMEGSYLIPTSLNIQTDAIAALDSLKQVYGPFGYGLATQDPVGVSTYMGDTFLPVLRNPDIIWQAIVSGF